MAAMGTDGKKGPVSGTLHPPGLHPSSRKRAFGELQFEAHDLDVSRLGSTLPRGTQLGGSRSRDKPSRPSANYCHIICKASAHESSLQRLCVILSIFFL